MIVQATTLGTGVLMCVVSGCESPCQSTQEEAQEVVDFLCPDTSSLAVLSKQEDREFLRRFLASDGEWRVTDDGAIVAAPRGRQMKVDVRIRFGPYERTPSWMADALKAKRLRVVAAGKEATVRLPLWKATHYAPDTLASCVMFGAGDVWIELREWSNDRSRDATREAIVDVMGEIKKILDLARNTEEAGYWQRVLSKGSLASKSALSIRKQKDGTYVIKGHVNPRRSGYIILRAVHAKTGEEIQAEKSVQRRNEYVGWSREPTVFFPFESEYWPPDTGRKTPVRFEVWFYPSEGEKLLERIEPDVLVLVP